jgi:EmrB/QacA subfamily drug resistance transporter
VSDFTDFPSKNMRELENDVEKSLHCSLVYPGRSVVSGMTVAQDNVKTLRVLASQTCQVGSKKFGMTHTTDSGKSAIEERNTSLGTALKPPLLSERRQDTPQTSGKWAVLFIVSIGTFMATLDSSIVNISLPTIAHAFGVALSGAIEWVIIAYLIGTAATLLTAGRVADMIGRKTVWLAGLVIFTGSSAICGLAPSPGILIAARLLQGIGGALLMGIGLGMVSAVFPASERGRALGLSALTVAFGVSSGPVLGGLITAYLSWRWIFYLNLPIGLLGVLVTLKLLKEQRRHTAGRFDPLGAVWLAAGMAGLTGGLSFGQEIGWTSPLILVPLVGGVIALICLPFIERRVANPILLLALFRSRVFSSSALSLLLCYLSLFAVGFLLPFYLEELRGFPTQVAGLLLVPFPATLALFAPLSGSLADRFGSRWLAAGGLALACGGLVLISQLNETSSIWDIIWRLIVTGAGQALFQSPNNSAMLGAAPSAYQGSASGFLATARTMGQSASVAVAGAVFTGLGGAAAGRALLKPLSPTQALAYRQVFTHSFQVTFLVCALIVAPGILAAFLRGKEAARGARGHTSEETHR